MPPSDPCSPCWRHPVPAAPTRAVQRGKRRDLVRHVGGLPEAARQLLRDRGVAQRRQVALRRWAGVAWLTAVERWAGPALPASNSRTRSACQPSGATHQRLVLERAPRAGGGVELIWLAGGCRWEAGRRGPEEEGVRMRGQSHGGCRRNVAPTCALPSTPARPPCPPASLAATAASSSGRRRCASSRVTYSRTCGGVMAWWRGNEEDATPSQAPERQSVALPRQRGQR